MYAAGLIRGRSVEGTPAMYWNFVVASVKIFSRMISRFTGELLDAHNASTGSQNGCPRPSI